MSTKKYVKIVDKSVDGIINPLLSVQGKFLDKERKLYVEANGEIIKSKVIILNQKSKKFVVRAVLPKNVSKVRVYIKDKNEKIKICSVSNNVFTRIYNKLIKNKIIILKKISKKPKKIFKSINVNIKYLWNEHRFIIPKELKPKYRKEFKTKVRKALGIEYYNPFKQKDYLKWLEHNEKFHKYKKLKYEPLISFLIPVYNIDRKYLSECLDSILNQTYKNFEICLSDDNSTSQETIDTLKEYEKKDKRVKVVYRKENGHISKATNSALEIAKGEFVALMDDDDILSKHALYEMVYVLNKNKNLDLIYSDEDKMDMKGRRCEPHFKPDYSPDSLYGGNYICHFEILRRSIMNEIGGFKSEFVGAQDFDLFLRFVEKTTPDRIYHIPKILYHWRKVPGSTADTIENKEYAIENGRKAVEEALKRRKTPGKVIVPITSTHYIVEYDVKKEPLVSIIIPTKDLADVLEKCLKSIYKKTTYKNYEIIVVNNNSKKQETFDLLNKYSKKYNNFRVVDADMEFNFSKINNLAVKKAKGEYLLFLNNDTEVITPNWLTSMVGYAMQKHIGAVGTLLRYKDNTIQHGGVVVGIDGMARHAFLNEEYDSYGFYGRLIVPYNYTAVTAACMMVSKKKFKEVDGFNEDLKVAFNDVDFCIKLVDEGYYNVFLPQVELYHYESKSRGFDSTVEKYNQFLKEKEYLNKKWKKYIDNDPFYNINFSKKDVFMLERK